MPMHNTVMNRLTAALLALALAILGFGHQQSGATPAIAPADPLLAAYLQTGGALDELCIQEQDGPQRMAQDCPVCTLAQAMALGCGAAGVGLAQRLAPFDPAPEGHLPARAHSLRAPPARGPPAPLA